MYINFMTFYVMMQYQRH